MNTSLSLATAPDTDEAPCTTTALLAEGLRWLYDTVQPDTAIVHARGAATVIAPANRIIRWVPLGWGWTANVVLEVAHIDWGLGMGPPLNPMPSSEAISLAVELHHIGVDIADIACTTRCLSAAIVAAPPGTPHAVRRSTTLPAGLPLPPQPDLWPPTGPRRSRLRMVARRATRHHLAQPPRPCPSASQPVPQRNRGASTMTSSYADPTCALDDHPQPRQSTSAQRPAHRAHRLHQRRSVPGRA